MDLKQQEEPTQCPARIELISDAYSQADLLGSLGDTPHPTDLILHSNSEPRIIVQIEGIVGRQGFGTCLLRLRILNLACNNIESLDALQRLQLPLLSDLHLFNNNLHSLGPLRKVSCPSLAYLSIVNNRVRSLSVLSECHCPKLDLVWAYDNEIVDGSALARTESPLRASIVGFPDSNFRLQANLFRRHPRYESCQFDPHALYIGYN